MSEQSLRTGVLFIFKAVYAYVVDNLKILVFMAKGCFCLLLIVNNFKFGENARFCEALSE